MTSEIFIRNRRACIVLAYVLLVLSAKVVTGAATGSLWDETNVGPSLTNQQQDFTGLELGAIDPGQLVAFEANKRYGIFNDTLELSNAMKTCQAMLFAAYRLSKYVPQNRTEVWDGMVIKIMVQTLNQDVSARSLISKCFGRIRDLGIVIQNVYKIVKRTKGSKRGIELAKRNVPAALDKITDCIRSVDKLDGYAVKMFAENADTFFKIIGSEAANFTRERIPWDVQIQQARAKQQELITELGMWKGEVASNYYLMTMTQKYVAQTDEELQAAKRRMERLKILNAEVDEAIKNIPQTVERTESVSKGFGIGPFSATWTESHLIQVPNPDREAQMRHYNDVIDSRAARLLSMETDGDAKEIAIVQLRKDLAGYIDDYNRTLAELTKFQDIFKTDFGKAEEEVQKALDAKREIDRRADALREQFGLDGMILIEALEHVEVFSKSLNPVATAYSPFAAILNTIKSLVETHVELLSSDEPSDIFLAATLLIDQARFLSDYVVGAQQILYSKEDYNGTAIAEKPMQGLLS